MSEVKQTGRSLYTLVDASALETIMFLKRAPLKETLLWQKVFEQQGKKAVQLDMLELEELQYLFWNATKTAPSDDKRTLLTQCEELAATNIRTDETSLENLDALVKATQPRKDSMAKKKEGELKKPSAAAAATKTKKKDKEVEAAPADPKPKREKDPTGRPSEGTATGKVWDIADKLAADNDDVTPTRQEVIEAAVEAGVNKATAGVQYGNWIKGMKRAPAPKPEPEEDEEAADEDAEDDDDEDAEEETAE
jgi:hypothetical protein